MGVAVAQLLSWTSGAERDLHIHIGDVPVLPLEGNRMRHSLMLVVTVLLVQFVTRVLDLPASTALVSVMLLTIAPDLQALLQKGRLRLFGAILAQPGHSCRGPSSAGCHILRSSWRCSSSACS